MATGRWRGFAVLVDAEFEVIGPYLALAGDFEGLAFTGGDDDPSGAGKASAPMEGLIAPRIWTLFLRNFARRIPYMRGRRKD